MWNNLKINLQCIYQECEWIDHELTKLTLILLSAELFVIGIAGANETELLPMASEPKSTHYKKLATYKDLMPYINTINENMNCSVV